MRKAISRVDILKISLAIELPCDQCFLLPLPRTREKRFCLHGTIERLNVVKIISKSSHCCGRGFDPQPDCDSEQSYLLVLSSASKVFLQVFRRFSSLHKKTQLINPIHFRLKLRRSFQFSLHNFYFMIDNFMFCF